MFYFFRLSIAGMAALAFTAGAVAGEWPPSDPKEYVTKTDFTIAWAKKLAGFRTLSQLQRAAGSRGTISERKLAGDDPYVSFHWRSEPPNNDRIGYMVAIVRPDGSVGAEVVTDEVVSITVNTLGALICDKCSPPIEIQGLDPSWAKTK